MKNLFLLFVTVAFTSTVFSQEEIDEQHDDDIVTLVGKGKSVGGYGGISIMYSEIDNKSAMVFGARGGVVFGHSFTIGLGGAGFINEFHYGNDQLSNERYSLAGGYGGLVFEPILFPRKPIHVSFPILCGVGGVANSVQNRDSLDSNELHTLESDVFMLIEPGIELEMNITRFFRFSIGATYRLSSKIDIPEVGKNALNGFSVGVTLKFGKF